MARPYRRPVPVPGMPGERIDPAILPDLQFLLTNYKGKLTAGYATSGHSPRGEHPLGLGADIVPDTARGGTWDDIDRLAKVAKQTQQAGIFRWVGYDGEPGHGRGHHLHISWDHDPKTGKVKTLSQSAGLGGVLKDINEFDLTDFDPDKAAGDVAGDVVSRLVGGIFDLFGESGPRAALYVGLVATAAVLIVMGTARATGVRTPGPAKLAAAVATRNPKAAMAGGAK